MRPTPLDLSRTPRITLLPAVKERLAQDTTTTRSQLLAKQVRASSPTLRKPPAKRRRQQRSPSSDTTQESSSTTPEEEDRGGRGGLSDSWSLAMVQLASGSRAPTFSGHVPKAPQGAVQEPSVCPEEDLQHFLRQENLWRVLVSQGFHLLFYGLGSKRFLLHHICQEILCPLGSVVVINGFFIPSASHSDLLKRIAQLTEIELVSGDLALTLDFLVRQLDADVDRAPPVFLVLYGADQRMFFSAKWRMTLRSLARTRRIRFVGSIDSALGAMSASALLSTWYWIHVCTHVPLLLETRFVSSLLESDPRKTLEGLREIYEALAPSTKRVFMTIGERGGEQGVPFRDLLKACQEQMVLVSDQQLMVCVKELMDHGLVSKVQGSGRERLFRCVASARVLREFLGG